MKPIAINLKVSRNRDFKRQFNAKKHNVVDWSIQLSGKTERNDFDFHWVWKSDDGRYRVGFGKYGKEYYLTSLKRKDNTVGNNSNDMWTVVEKDGKIVDFDGSFDHVFRFFQHVQKQCGDDMLNYLGCILIRNAYMLDHKLKDGKYYYLPDKAILKPFIDALPEYEGISTEAYLHYIDGIAQNEDVKYKTLGFDIESGIGRENNIRTYAYIIAVLLGEMPLSKLCSTFARPPVGVAPIPFKDMVKVFSSLNIE